MASAWGKIPFQRQISYLALLAILPMALVSIHLFTQHNHLVGIADALEEVHDLVLIKESKQALNISVRNYYREADHFYIDKYVESLTFLEAELENLQKITNHKNFTEDESIKQRLEFLTNSNGLVFAEGVVQSYPTFQETVESLVHPVELSVGDLQKVLSTIEGVQMGPYVPGPNRPQLMITDFKLEKKRLADKNEVFVLDMKVLKREFI